MNTPHPEFWFVLTMALGIALHWQDKLAKAKPLGLHMFWCALVVLLYLMTIRTLHFP